MHHSETGNIRTAQPRILVLGATGGTGRLIVSEAVARGYDVTVLVRSAEKASALKGAKLIAGDARDEKALRQALKGRDAVISALGTLHLNVLERTTNRQVLLGVTAPHITQQRWGSPTCG